MFRADSHSPLDDISNIEHYVEEKRETETLSIKRNIHRQWTEVLNIWFFVFRVALESFKAAALPQRGWFKPRKECETSRCCKLWVLMQRRESSCKIQTTLYPSRFSAEHDFFFLLPLFYAQPHMQTFFKVSYKVYQYSSDFEWWHIKKKRESDEWSERV